MAPASESQQGSAPSAVPSHPKGPRRVSGPRSLAVPSRNVTGRGADDETDNASATRPGVLPSLANQSDSLLDQLLGEEDSFKVGPERTPPYTASSLPTDPGTGGDGIQYHPETMSQLTTGKLFSDMGHEEAEKAKEATGRRRTAIPSQTIRDLEATVRDLDAMHEEPIAAARVDAFTPRTLASVPESQNPPVIETGVPNAVPMIFSGGPLVGSPQVMLDSESSIERNTESKNSTMTSKSRSKGPRLSVNTTLAPPSRPQTPPPISPGMKRWQQVREHVMQPTPVDERQATGSGSAARGGPPKKLGIVSKAAKQFGFRNAVENVMGYDRTRMSTIGMFGFAVDLSPEEREEASRERRRFARDVKACLDFCALEETNRRLRQMAQVSGTNDMAPPQSSKARSAHHLHLDRGHQRDHHAPSVDTGPVFSAFAPLLTELHKHLPDARAKRVWSRTCPHHAAILAELGVTFLPDSASTDGERAQALEVFGTVVRNWASDSSDEELDRWLWLCRAMLVDDKALRNRGLDLLSAVLRRNPALPESFARPPTATDFESLTIALIKLLHALENAPYPSEQQAGLLSDLIRDVSQGEIVRVDPSFLEDTAADIGSDSPNRYGIERELLWMAAGRAVNVEPNVTAWLLNNNAEVLKRFAPTPILHATPPVVLRLRVDSAIQFFGSFSSIIRTTSNPDIIPSVADVVDFIFNESEPLPDEQGNLVSAYVTVLIDLTLKRYRSEVDPHDPFATSMARSSSAAQRMRLLNLLKTGPKDAMDRSAQQLVGSYPLSQVMEAVRNFLDSDLAILGQKCVPLLLKRLTLMSSANPDVKHFLVWLAARHPQLFYKPLFACAAATQPSSLASGLQTITALSELLGPTRYWTQVDPQMVAIVLMGDVGPRQAKGKAKEGSPNVVTVKLGRYAMLVELILALGKIVHVSPELRTFLTTLESRLGSLLEVEEKEGTLPVSYRSLVCQALKRLRDASSWTQRTATTRLGVSWYKGNPVDLPTASEYVDIQQLGTLRGIYDTLDKTLAKPRLDMVNIPLITSLSSLLVTIQISLTPDDWTILLPIVWERYGQPDEPIAPMTFLMAKCAEQVPESFRLLVTTDLALNGPQRCKALLKLAMMYGYRFQILNQDSITDRRGAVFKFAGKQLEFILTEVGSAEWVVPRDAQDAALQKYGRGLPLELRQRLLELGWSEDDTMKSSDYERIPVTLLPPATSTEHADQRDRAPSPSPSPTPSPAAKGRPVTLSRTVSNSSMQSITNKTRRAVLPPIVTALINEQARLLLDSDDVATDSMSYELIRMLEREDPTLFARPVTENFPFDLPSSLARLNAVVTAPTPSFAYVAINSLIGFLKMMVRNDPVYPQWSLVLSTISRIIPHVSELSLRDIRKSKAEYVLLPGAIHEDDSGFKLHTPWQQDILDVQTAQLVILTGVLRANPRDVYLIKKMLFNLQVQASFTHLPFARAWLELAVVLFSGLNSNYNDRAELRHFLNNISSVLALHGTTDIVVAALSMRALSICSTRFRRVLASIGFVPTMRVVYDTYVNCHRGIKDAIEYACRSFYRIHQDVFVYQLSLAIADNPFDSAAAYDLLVSLSVDNNSQSGVPSGIRGLNDRQEIETLVHMVSGGAEVTFSELGTRAEERRANKIATLSLELTVFPRENIIRLFVTVIAVNAASARSIKLMRLFARLVPLMTDPKSQELLPDAIDAIGRFVHKGRAGDDAAMLRFLPGEENGVPDWTGANREYVFLVDAFSRCGGRLSVHVTRRMLDIVMSLLQDDPKSIGPTASSILGSLARTHLASRHPTDFLRDIASAYRQHMATIDFSGVLDAIAELIRRSHYQLSPEMTAIVVNEYVDPAIRMLALASEESMAFIVPLRTAAVELLATTIFLRGSDAFKVVEDVVCTPGLLASVILPLSLMVDRPQDVNRDDEYANLWPRLLRCVLKPKKGPRRHTKEKADTLAATAVLSLQTVKVIVVRAPECISGVRGLWTYISSTLLGSLTDGNGRFFEPTGGAPAVPRVVDWMMWSLFELLVLHRTTLNVDFRLRIQTTLSKMNSAGGDGERSRPSSIASSISHGGQRAGLFGASPVRSLSGFVRRPSARVPPALHSPTHLTIAEPVTPSHSRSPSASHNRTPSASHTRTPSASGTPRLAGVTPSPRLSSNPPSPRLGTHARIRSISNTNAGGMSSLIRPSFATLSARRASRPVFEVFAGGSRSNRFPSSAPVRNLGGGEKSAIVHLLGPATQVVSATSANISVTSTVDPTRNAIRDLRINTDSLVHGARTAVSTTMAVYGYEPDTDDMLHVWGVTDALHIIAEQTKTLVEEEFHDVFNPPHDNASVAHFASAVDLSEKLMDDDEKSMRSIGKHSKRSSYGDSDDEPSFQFTLQHSYEQPSFEFHDATTKGRTHDDVVPVPILSISPAA